MGKSLVIKGADFSQNAVSLNDMFNLLYEPATVTGGFNNGLWIHTTEQYANQTIYAIRIKVNDTLDYSGIDTLKFKLYKVSYTTMEAGDPITVLQEMELEIPARGGYHDIILPEPIVVGSNHLGIKADNVSDVGQWFSFSTDSGLRAIQININTNPYSFPGGNGQSIGIGLTTYGI